MLDEPVHQLNEQAYQLIWKKIERGDLRPGDMVNARDIGKEFGASFTPVREAIARLVEEGLVHHQFGVGTFVTIPTRKDVANLFQLREMVESFAAEQATTGLVLDTTQAMRQANDRMRQLMAEVETSHANHWPAEYCNEWIDCDRQFHRVLLRSLDNQAVSTSLERVMSCLMVWARWIKMEARAKTCDEHELIVDAMQRGDGVAARQGVASHLHVAREAILQDFDLYQLQWKHPQV